MHSNFAYLHKFSEVNSHTLEQRQIMGKQNSYREENQRNMLYVLGYFADLFDASLFGVQLELNISFLMFSYISNHGIPGQNMGNTR